MVAYTLYCDTHIHQPIDHPAVAVFTQCVGKYRNAASLKATSYHFTQNIR